MLAGECLLIIEEQERPLRAWDFVHCPAGTNHVFVGAGDGPCVILMVGARPAGRTIDYPRSEPALAHGAGVETPTALARPGLRPAPGLAGGAPAGVGRSCRGRDRDAARTAACSCGQLRVEVSGDPLIVSLCHCLACQRGRLAFGLERRPTGCVTATGAIRASPDEADRNVGMLLLLRDPASSGHVRRRLAADGDDVPSAAGASPSTARARAGRRAVLGCGTSRSSRRGRGRRRTRTRTAASRSPKHASTITTLAAAVRYEPGTSSHAQRRGEPSEAVPWPEEGYGRSASAGARWPTGAQRRRPRPSAAGVAAKRATTTPP